MDTFDNSSSSAFGGPQYPIAIWLNSVISVFAVLENLFILLLFMQQRKCLDISHKFVVSMALADLLEGLFGAPLTAVMASGLRSGPFLCLGTLTVKITIHMLTVFGVVMTSIDRFWAIVAPFNHRYHRTNGLATLMIVIAWGIPISLGVIGFGLSSPAERPDAPCFARARFSKAICNVVAFGINVPAMLLVFIMYSIIYFKLLKIHEYSMLKLLREMRKMIKERNTITEDEDNLIIGGGLKRKEVRTTIWIFLTVVCFWICWGSIVVATLLLIYYKNSVSNVTMRYAVQTIVAINSCVNPLLYAFHIKRVKQAAIVLKNALFCPANVECDKSPMSFGSDPGYSTESENVKVLSVCDKK